MKLRNKKTGEIIRFYDGIRLNGEDYDSLAELNEEWEDYEPKNYAEKKMEEIIKQIIEWGNEKGINNPHSQFRKLTEETLEAHEALLEEKFCDIYAPQEAITEDWSMCLKRHLKEELGDIGVVWVLLCDILGVKPLEALEAAHNKNKDRKGKTINGNFIKEEDL